MATLLCDKSQKVLTIDQRSRNHKQYTFFENKKKKTRSLHELMTNSHESGLKATEAEDFSGSKPGCIMS